MTSEKGVIAQLKYGDALSVVIGVVAEFVDKYKRQPNMIAINVILQPAVESQLITLQTQVLPIPSQDIAWFQRTEVLPSWHSHSGADYVMVFHTDNPSLICYL